MAARQIALPLGLAAPEGSVRIVVGNANNAAAEAFSNLEAWPFRTAILFGPPRSGKSLLANWFAGQGLGDALDDADKADETELFHRWNRAQESATPLLLTAVSAAEGDEAAADGTSGTAGGRLIGGRWRIDLPDLASRLGAALHLEIGAPDDEMLADLIAAHAEMRALALGEDAIRYLATRAERSHLAAERLVAAIDRLSLERKVPPGPAIWREALDEVSGASPPRLP